jgi:hypothetical protein
MSMNATVQLPPYYPSISLLPFFLVSDLTHSTDAFKLHQITTDIPIIVRYILLLLHNPQRLRNTPNAHGIVGKQSSHPQVIRHNNSDCGGSILDMAFGLLKSQFAS